MNKKQEAHIEMMGFLLFPCSKGRHKAGHYIFYDFYTFYSNEIR